MRSSGRGWMFLIGLGIGAGAAILLAPCSGEETRERIAHTTRDATKAVQRTVEDLRTQFEDSVQGISRQMRSSMKQVSNTLQDAVRTGKEAYREQLNRVM